MKRRTVGTALSAALAAVLIVGASPLGISAAVAANAFNVGSKNCPALYLATSKLTSKGASGHEHKRASDGYIQKSDFNVSTSSNVVTYRAFFEDVSQVVLFGSPGVNTPTASGVTCTR